MFGISVRTVVVGVVITLGTLYVVKRTSLAAYF